MSNMRSSSLFLLATTTAFCLSPMTLAQPRVIEEVVVTAQKTEQSLQDVPVSVSTLGGETVEQAGLDDVQDMVMYVPNVKYSSGGATPVLAIRGFGSGLAGRGIESPVGSVIDDVFYGHASYLNDGVFDLQRMEVLRGPQGALFGKNTIAGVLNFHTNGPNTEEWEANISALYSAPVDGAKYEGGVSIPLIADKLGARVSFRSNRRDTGSSNSTLDDKPYTQEDVSGRLRMLWQASDSIDMHFNYWYSYRQKNGADRPILEATQQSLDEFRTHDPEVEDDPFDQNSSTDFHGFFNRRAEGSSLKAEWRPEIGGIDGATLTAIYAYATTQTPFDNDADFSPITLINFATDGPDVQRQRSLELRFSGSTAAPFGWGNGADFIVGLFGQRAEGRISNIITAYLDGFPDYVEAGAAGGPDDPTPLGDAITNNLIDLNSAVFNSGLVEEITSSTTSGGSTQALFSQLIWYLRDDLDLTLGLRLGRERKEAEIFSRRSPDNSTNIAAELLAQEDFEASRRLSENEVSPKVAVAWHWTEEVTFWANVAKGFKSGGFQAAPVNPTDLRFDAENALSIEAGIKARLFDGSLVVNANVYRTNFDNLQVILFDGINFLTQNAAEAITQGVELDFIWLPQWQWLTVAGSIGTTDAYYTSYPCAPLAEDGSSTENPACEQLTGGTGQDLEDEVVAYAPDITASLYPTINFPLFPSLDINALIGIDILYTGEFYLDYDLDENTYRDPETRVNLRFGIAAGDGTWSVVFNAKNVTAAEEIGAMIDQPLLSGNYVGFVGNPDPQYTVDFRYKFPGE